METYSLNLGSHKVHRGNRIALKQECCTSTSPPCKPGQNMHSYILLELNYFFSLNTVNKYFQLIQIKNCTIRSMAV